MRNRIPNPGVAGGSNKTAVLAPTGDCGGRKPVSAITDRAKRYRANSDACKPKGPRVCWYCGSGKNVDVHHRDGREDNGRRANLKYACRSCNAKIAALHKRIGKGIRVRQYNAAEGKPKYPTFAQYTYAAAQLHQRKNIDEGGAIIAATPEWLRRQYAAEIWSRRRARGTDKWKQSDIPF